MKNGKANGDFDWNDHHHLSVVLLPACLARPTLAANVTKSFGSTFLHNLLKKRTFEKKEYTTKLSNSIT
jgi:hypothetical protein